jgi:signal transduction histidine kinase
VNEIVRNMLSEQAAGPRTDSAGWLSPVLSVHGVADVLIGVSCFSIGIALIYFAHKRRDLHAGWAAIPCALLLLPYGMFSLGLPWNEWDKGSAFMKVLTACVSIAAAISVWPLILLAIRQPARRMEQMQSVISQLEHEIAERKRAEEELQKSRESLRQLAAYQEQIKEDERKRIAREIHDELGQNLMALRIDVSLLHARTGKSHPILNEKVKFVLKQIDTSIKAVRAIINNLRPAVLDLGLYAAIEWQVAEFERRTGIACELSMDEHRSDSELDDNRATALFRILQESLSNVARHAQATLVNIELRKEGRRFVMRIADNGVGMYPGCRRKPNSFGLLGIGERISTLGGEFTVEGAPGQGTVLTITIPIEEAVSAA